VELVKFLVFVRQSSRHPEVAQEHIALVVNEQVCRLNVSVDDASFVDELHSTKSVVKHNDHMVLGQPKLRS
jgi:hypothetical protein